MMDDLDDLDDLDCSKLTIIYLLLLTLPTLSDTHPGLSMNKSGWKEDKSYLPYSCTDTADRQCQAILR